MAFSSTVTKSMVQGRWRRSFGTFTNTAGSSGGTVSTGLKFLQTFDVNSTDSHMGTESPKITLNSPAAGQAVIVLSTQQGATAMTGQWEATGL